MKIKNSNIQSTEKEKKQVKKNPTVDNALKAKHDLAREFFKNVILPA